MDSVNHTARMVELFSRFLGDLIRNTVNRCTNTVDSVDLTQGITEEAIPVGLGVYNDRGGGLPSGAA